MFFLVLWWLEREGEEEKGEGKVCVVTGAASGIGLQTSRELVKRGCFVWALDRNEKALEESFKGEKKVRCERCDVTDEDSVARVSRLLRETNTKVWALVNNAGISECGKWRASMELEVTENVRGLFSVNFEGVVRCIKHIYPSLSPGGRIINLGSVSGVLPFPFASICKSSPKKI